MTLVKDVLDAHRVKDWRTWRILRRRRFTEDYLAVRPDAGTFVEHKEPYRATVPSGRKAQLRQYACGCKVPQGYPLYRRVWPCALHKAALGWKDRENP